MAEIENKEEVKEEVVEKTSEKAKVEEKIRKQIQKKQEKQENSGISRVLEYLKTEHKWENYLFVFVSVVTLLLGCLMLAGSIAVKEDAPLIGDYPKQFAWALVIISGIGLIYALYPFFKPAFPEFKKISWLTIPKFIGNVIRVFLFLAIFTLLFLLYDSFIAEILLLIIK